MSVTYLDQLSTETSPLSSDKLLGVRGTGVGSERLYRVDSFDAAGTAELEVQKLFSPGGTFKTEYFLQLSSWLIVSPIRFTTSNFVLLKFRFTPPLMLPHAPKMSAWRYPMNNPPCPPMLNPEIALPFLLAMVL